MKIAGHTIETIDIRLNKRITTGAGSFGDRSGVRLVLRTSDGALGRGESAPLPGVGDAGSLEHLAAEVKGWADKSTGTDVDSLMASIDDHGLSPVARFAVHTALAELQSIEAGTPLAEWLRSGSLSSVRVNALVAEESPGEVHEATSDAVAQGATAVKLKVGMFDTAKDATRIIAASEACGPRIELRLDANRAWSVEDAIHVVGRVGKHRISYIEDPTKDHREYGRVVEETGLAVAVDAPPDVATQLVALVEATGATVLVAKPASVGGIDRIMNASRELAPDKSVVVSSSIDGPIALLAGLHAAAAVLVDTAHGLATGPLVRGMPEALLPIDGAMTLPSGPGLGEVEV